MSWAAEEIDLVDGLAAFNRAEAGLWAAFALATALAGGRVRGLTPRLRIGLVAAFLAFGVSDLIEAWTGAWWRPPALLVLKGACLLAIVAASGRLWLHRRRVGPSDATGIG
jgi:hypothetical protein